MARSKYIYLVFMRNKLLSAHTVKYEAHQWLEQSKWTPEQTQLKRMKDGRGHGLDIKELVDIEWEF